MKIDFITDSSEDCPFIRLYDFGNEEIQRLRQAFQSLADGSFERVSMTDVLPADATGGLQLTFVRASRDRGVEQREPNHFEVLLTPDGWLDCLGLAEPFLDAGSGYQWLTDYTCAGDIRWLLSRDGSW